MPEPDLSNSTLTRSSIIRLEASKYLMRRALMEFISSEYDGIRPTISPEEMAIWLKEFHTKLAQALHNGEAVLDMVPE
jgi:hypothetical protein